MSVYARCAQSRNDHIIATSILPNFPPFNTNLALSLDETLEVFSLTSLDQADAKRGC